MPDGTFHALWLFDVAEAIDLEALRQRTGQKTERTPQFRLPAPVYVRFAQPPLIVAGDTVDASGATFCTSLKFFDYGVVSVQLTTPVSLSWSELTHACQRWIASPEIEGQARSVATKALGGLEGVLVKPAPEWMSEDYYVVHLLSAGPSAQEFAAERRSEIAQIVRGEGVPLSDGEQTEILRGSISYYPNDLLVAGWTGAVIYDTNEGASDTIQILEYANTQLLEFRFFDEVMTRELAMVYRSLETRKGMFSRWRMVRDAERLNALRLDVVELAERSDNALKFMGDMFYARTYRLVSERIGVNDYRKLVDDKLATARDLYDFMVNEFHHVRAYVLELAVVVILIIDLYFILREAKVF